MSIRRIDTTISTIRSLFDENGNYVPSGNYYFSIKDYDSGVFTGEMTSRGHFGEFTFSPRNSLIASLILAFSTGIPMWGVAKSLLKDIELGELKEIVPGEF